MWSPVAMVGAGVLVNAPVATRWIAEAVDSSTSTTNLFTALSSVGVTGIFAYLLARGQLVPKSHYDYARKDAEESRARELALYEQVINGVVPALRDATWVASTPRRKAGGG